MWESHVQKHKYQKNFDKSYMNKHVFINKFSYFMLFSIYFTSYTFYSSVHLFFKVFLIDVSSGIWTTVLVIKSQVP